MNYFFNIKDWFLLNLHKTLQFPNRLIWLNAVSTPIKSLLNDFEAFRLEINNKTKYSSEQASLQYLLNTLFDATYQRIRIETTSDVKPSYFQFYSDETGEDFYSFFASEIGTNPENYSYYKKELVNAYSFIVWIPTSLDSEATKSKIKSWVDYYRLATKNFIIKTI